MAKLLTIKQLVDQHEIVLDILLGYLAKIALHHVDDLQQELKHHRCVHILLCDGGKPDVCTLEVRRKKLGTS